MVKSCIVAELIRQNVEPVEGRAVLCRGEGGIMYSTAGVDVETAAVHLHGRK